MSNFMHTPLLNFDKQTFVHLITNNNIVMDGMIVTRSECCYRFDKLQCLSDLAILMYAVRLLTIVMWLYLTGEYIVCLHYQIIYSAPPPPPSTLCL